MNRLLIFDFDINKKKAKTSDLDIITHVETTLKLKENQRALLALANYGHALGKVTSLDQKKICFELSDVKEIPRSLIHVEVAASRPPTMKKVLEHGSSLGVNQFTIYKGELSDKSYLQSHIYNEESLKKQTSLGISQGKSLCHLPIVTVSERKSSHKSSQKYVLSLHSQKTFMSENIDFTKPLTLLVGPERGFTAAEEERATQDGYIPITISEQTLRVEIALFVALGQLEMLRLSR